MARFWRRRYRNYYHKAYSTPAPYDWLKADTQKAHLHREFGSLLGAVEQKFFHLTSDQRQAFFRVLEENAGQGAREYAQANFAAWATGWTEMSSKTRERILHLVPKVLSKEDKFELVELAWDLWTKKSRRILYVTVPANATFDAIFARIESAYIDFKAHRFATTDYAQLQWLFDADIGKVQSKCFVATACYVDSDHPNLVFFREFRDRTLLATCIGRAFVTVYYAVGPWLASVVTSLPAVRRGCTAGLDYIAERLRRSRTDTKAADVGERIV